ncbi:MAG: hypothetical protein WBB76_05455 [Gaiellaceae bacterium]
MATALLAEELWKLIEPLLPVRKRRYRLPGRKRADDRSMRVRDRLRVFDSWSVTIEMFA